MGFRRYECGKVFYAQIKDGWFEVKELNLKCKVHDASIHTCIDNSVVISDETILTGISDYKVAYIIPNPGIYLNIYKEGLGYIRTVQCELQELTTEPKLAGYITGDTIGTYYPVFKDPGENDWYHIGGNYASFKRSGKITSPPIEMPINVFKGSAFIKNTFVHTEDGKYVIEAINNIEYNGSVSFMALST